MIVNHHHQLNSHNFFDCISYLLLQFKKNYNMNKVAPYIFHADTVSCITFELHLFILIIISFLEHMKKRVTYVTTALLCIEVVIHIHIDIDAVGSVLN